MSAELARLARVRAGTLELVAGMSQGDLDRRPAGGGWSVGEILDHLEKAEAANRGEIAELIALARAGREPFLYRGLTPAGPSPAFLPPALLPWLSLPLTLATLCLPDAARELLIRRRLVPARAADALQPRPGRPAGELRAGLAASLAETRSLLAANADLDFRRMVLLHPLFGAADALGIVALTAAHEERHQEQIRATAAAL